MRLLGLWFIVVLCRQCMLLNVAQPDEQRLHSFLKSKNVSKLIRPTGNSSVKLTVKLGMRLSQLLNVDERNQIMTTSVWLRQEWMDQRLKWDPQEHGGINMTHIPSEELWRPDIVLYNNADGEFVVTLKTKATVFYDGKIVWEPPVIYKSYCPIDVEYFPFDMQECFMKLSSWTYDGHEDKAVYRISGNNLNLLYRKINFGMATRGDYCAVIDLQHLCDSKAITKEGTNEKVIDRGIDLKDYYQNVEWDIINVTASRKEKFYPCCPEPYPDITFNITLRRRTLFYSLNLIMPCLAISCLTVLVFYLPSDSGEKITLSISILLALTVFFLLLSDINPPTSFVIPLIGKYLLFTMIVVTMSIFLAVYTLGIHFRKPSTHKMNPWVKRVFTEILPRILLMKRPDLDRKQKVTFRTPNGIEMREVGFRDFHSSTEMHLNTSGRNTPNTFDNIHNNQQGTPTGYDEITRYPKEVREAIEGVKFVADHLRSTDADNMEERDWKYVAMVMDRLFLYIFTTACVCGTLSIFLYAPSLYDGREALALQDPTDSCTY